MNNSKNFSFDRFTERNIQGFKDNFKKSKIVILGLGGLGSNVALLLARSGIGSLRLVDFDKVEVGNLNRQQYRRAHIGMQKTDAMKKIIEEVNPFVKIDIYNIKVSRENVAELTEGCDYICEAFDDAKTKADIISEILSSCPEKIIVSASGMAGLGSANEIKTKKVLKNLYVCGDEYSDFKEYEGMMAPRVMICAAHQANILLRLAAGEEK